MSTGWCLRRDRARSCSGGPATIQISRALYYSFVRTRPDPRRVQLTGVYTPQHNGTREGKRAMGMGSGGKEGAGAGACDRSVGPNTVLSQRQYCS